MALGKRRQERQLEAFAVVLGWPILPGPPFFAALNRLLAENGCDPLVEELCASYYAVTMGRPGVPPGIVLGMLFVGYIGGLRAYRSISWRCMDSRSLGGFLGLGSTDPVPNHSCVSKTHKRPQEVFNEVFRFILSVAAHKELLWGSAIGIGSMTNQANSSMAREVRKDAGKGWNDCTKKLADQARFEDSTDDELGLFDRNRLGKTVSSNDWEYPNDPDGTITRMNDGAARMACKAEHAVDLDSDIVVAATVHSSNAPDTQAIINTAIDESVSAEQAGVDGLQVIVAGKGCHSTKVVSLAADLGMRAYAPERAVPNQRRWTVNDPAEQRAVCSPRRRAQSERGKQLSRLRSEPKERSFAHVCDFGRATPSWLRELGCVTKRHLMMVAVRNNSMIMRMIFGFGGPRDPQGLLSLVQTAWIVFERLLVALDPLRAAQVAPMAKLSRAIGG